MLLLECNFSGNWRCIDYHYFVNVIFDEEIIDEDVSSILMKANLVAISNWKVCTCEGKNSLGSCKINSLFKSIVIFGSKDIRQCKIIMRKWWL